MKETEFDRLSGRLRTLTREIEALPKSRQIALVITKLDEADMWLQKEKEINPFFLAD